MEVAIPLETHEQVINLKLLKCRTEKLSKLLKNENLANIKSKIRKKRGVWDWEQSIKYCDFIHRALQLTKLQSINIVIVGIRIKFAHSTKDYMLAPRVVFFFQCCKWVVNDKDKNKK